MFKSILSQSGSEIENMVRASPIGATVIDVKSGRMIMANDAFLKIIGAASETEFLKVNPAETWPSIEDHKFAKACVLEKRKLVNFEARRKRLDGEIHWVLINSQPISFNRKPAYILWQIDITKRKNAEKTAQENQSHFQLICEASPVAIGITREADGIIIYGNKNYSDLLGFDLDELVGRNAGDVWAYPEEREYFVALFKKQGYISREVVRGRHKDGRILWLSVSWKSFIYQGEPSHLFWAYDITSQKETEAALSAAKEEAEQATRAKSDFLASMSHEIRTPLNGVLGLAEILKSSPLQADQNEKVETILETGQSLLSIINDVLDMSKIESGNVELEAHIFDLDDLLKSCIPASKNLANKKNLHFKFTNNLTDNFVVKGDATRLRQILWNLLSNALKFTEQGLVSLSIDQLPFNALPQGLNPASKDTHIRFEITDTGVGIPRDQIDDIFNSFSQADTSINRKFGGTGLGLSIVKRLVDLMNGTIKVRSESGSGSTFTIVLPLQLAEKTMIPLQTPATPVDPTKSYKICVVEDNNVNALIAQTFLQNAGHEVRLFENGLLAVEAAGDHWAELYLMDIHMPIMNGMEATEAIRKMGITIPIIGLTAEAFTDSHKLFKAAGMNEILTKPYKATQLVQIIADVMSKSAITAELS